MKIGGYFGLDQFYDVNDSELVLSTGRNSLEYILRANGYKTIYLPYYTCDSVLEPIKRLNIDYYFYDIDENLEIKEIPLLDINTALMYVNYFGVKFKYSKSLSNINNIIIDNTQSLYSKFNCDYFNSWRKFCGVFDGSDFNCKENIDICINKKKISNNALYLLERLDDNISVGYDLFLESEKEHNNNNNNIQESSTLSKVLFNNLDHNSFKSRRIDNFNYLHNKLSKYNELNIDINNDDVPMVYPLLIGKGSYIRNKLIENNIFVAKYWNNNYDMPEYETYLSNNLLPMPIDQRYGLTHMEYIFNKLKKWI
jgi:hypothetical protein